MQAKIINKEDKRYGKIFEVVERNEKFITIQDGDKKADYGHFKEQRKTIDWT